MKKMNKERFIDWAKARGWKLDRFGHLKKESNGKTFRFKLSRIAARYEQKTSAGWVRIKHALVKTGVGYFSKLSITDEGRLVGMRR